MKLTKKAHYSIKALLDICLQPGTNPASVKAIATRQCIPAPYLEKLLISLCKAGIIQSVRGRDGGYQLAREPDKISLGQILAGVGESIDTFPYDFPSQSLSSDWVTFSVWQRLSQKLKQTLYTITLADLYYDARSWQAAQGEETSFII